MTWGCCLTVTYMEGESQAVLQMKLTQKELWPSPGSRPHPDKEGDWKGPWRRELLQQRKVAAGLVSIQGGGAVARRRCEGGKAVS